MAARSSGGRLRSAARVSSSETAAASNSRRAEQVVLAALDGQQPHRRAGLLVAARAVEPQPRGPALAGPLALLEVGDPLAAAVGPLHARDEARHHGLQLLEDHRRVLARLGQRRREQAQQQLLVGLARGEDPDVRERRRGQQAAQQVERLRADRARVRGLGLAVGRAGSAPRPRPRRAAAPRSRHRRASPSPARTRARAAGSRQ